MPNPVKELAKLTCRAKQVDGTGFGGAVSDNLEVAAILGMPNPDTGKKLYREAYNLARYAYCADGSTKCFVKAALLHELIKADTGKISETVLLRLVNTSLREFQHPKTKLCARGEQVIQSYNDSEVASQIGIKRQSLTTKHKALYGMLVNRINIWSSDTIQHINSHYD